MTFCASASFEGAVLTMFTLYRQALKSACDELAASDVLTDEERWSVRDRAV